MLRKYLLLLIACLALVAASCSSSGDSDDDAGDGTTTTEASENEDGDAETEDDGDTDGTTVPEGDDEDEDDGGSTGSGDTSRQAYIDAMITNVTSDTEMPIEQDQAECLSEQWIDIVGHERLADAGITPEMIMSDDDDSGGIGDVTLDEDDANAMVDTFGDCGVDVTEMFIKSFEQDTTLTAEDRACLEGTFNEDFLRRLFVIGFTQGDDALDEDPELMGELMAAMFACPGAMGLDESDLEGMEGGL